MADDTKGTGGVEGLIDFSQIGTHLQQVAEEQQRAQQAAKRAAAVSVREAEKVKKSSQQYAERAARAQAELNQIDLQRAEAHRLRDSGNPLDRIELIGAQMLEPHRYTKAGRAQNTAEIQQTLSLAGQVHAVQTEQARAASALAQARAADAEVHGMATLEKIRTQVNTVAQLNQGLMQTEAMRMTALDMLTPGELADAMAGAPDDTGRIAVGDFNYKPFELAERHRALRERQIAASLPFDVSNSDALRWQQEALLANLSPREMEEVYQNRTEDGFYEFEGIRLDRSLFLTQLEQRREEERARNTRNLASHTAEQLLEESYAAALTRIEDMESRFGSEGPIGRAVRVYRAQVAALGDVAGQDGQGVTRPQQLALLNQAEGALRKAIDEEAELQAGTDKALKNILVNRYLGQPTSPAQLLDYASTRFADGKDFSRAFDSKLAMKLSRDGEKIYQRMLKDAEANYSKPGITERKELRKMALHTAFESAQDDAVSDAAGIAELSVTNIPGNPIKNADVTEGTYQQMVASAESSAALVTMDQYGLSEEQFEAAYQGRGDEVDLTPEQENRIAQTFNQNKIYQLYEQLEIEHEGLGDSYAAWLAQHNERILKDVVRARQGESAQLFSEGVYLTARDLNQTWARATQTAKPRRRQMAEERLLEMSRPEVKMPAMLQNMNELSKDMKGRVYHEVILPTLNRAKKERLSDADTSRLLLQALETPTGDKALDQATRKFVRAMPQIEDSYDTTMGALLRLRSRPDGAATGFGSSAFAPNRATTTVDEMDWMLPPK